MAALRFRRLLVLLASVCAATAAPVAPAPAETEGALSPAAGFELDPNLLQQTGVALASQHSKLMADTDVFGLYRDDPGPTPAPPAGLRSRSAGSLPPQMAAPAPALFVDPFAAFSGPVLPAARPAMRLTPVRWSGIAPSGATKAAVVEEGGPTEQEVDSTEPEVPVHEDTEATAPKESATPEASSVEPEEQSREPAKRSAVAEQPSAGSEQSPVGAELLAGPEALSAGPETRSARLQEAVAPEETVVGPSRAQPLTLPDTHIFCLLPEPGRHRAAPPAHAKDEHGGRAPVPGAAESGDKHAADPAAPSTAAAGDGKPGTTSGQTGAQPGSKATAGGNEDAPLMPPLLPDQTSDQQTPLLYQNQFGQTFSLSRQPIAEDEGAVFNQLWNQFGADMGPDGADGKQVMFEPFPDQSPFPGSESGANPDSLLDPSTFGQQPGKAQSADGAKQGPQEQLRSPTYFAPYPSQSQYSQRSTGYYPTASQPPAAYNPWGQPARRDSTWPYAARSAPTQVSRRTAYPAPWQGPGRGPTGARDWPWPALATESRGPPRAVPSSGVYFVPQSGRRQTVGGYPLYSQWYRPTVVPLPGGGGGGGGWWTPAGRFVRPATATATSEETGADSPPLNSDWAWPAVSMLGGRDALVVTGLGRSSGAMARAAGQHGWPPVAMASAGGTRSGGSFSRASSGGFDLIFQDGMFHTGPMALRMSPEEYVPPPKRPKKPIVAETEDAPEEAGSTKTGASEDDGEGVEEEVEGSGGEQ